MVAEMSVVASVIVKNEMGRYLRPFMDHIECFCDAVVVMDDGSTDGSGDYLEEKGALVRRLDPDDEFFAGHEGRRRQALLEFTLEQKPDWVLAIDADEFVTDGKAIREYADQPRQVGTLRMAEVWRTSHDALVVRQDGGWRPHPIPIMWRAQGVSPRRWRIRDRALACGREPEHVARMSGRGRPTGSSILHLGWAKESGRQARYDRYVVADGGKFHRNAHLDSIMWTDEQVLTELEDWPTFLLPYRDDIVEASR